MGNPLLQGRFSPSSPARWADMTTSFVIIVHFGLGIRQKWPPSGRAVFFWR